MFGLVQQHPLLLPTTLAHAASVYPETEIVSHSVGRETRLTYAEAHVRARRLASALQAMGFGEGAMAGALAWTTHRYFELFHALPGLGAVLHTGNPRMSAAQLAKTVALCGYEVMFVDPDTAPLAAEVAALAPNLRRFIAMCAPADLDAAGLGEVLFYEDLIAAGDPDFAWPTFDERTASTLCFTSGTTGDPKGALYSHRGTLLNALATIAPNALAISENDTALAISAFFHCNGWGLPFMAPMTGAKLVLPGRDLSSAHLQQLIVDEGVTFTGGVPTIWLDMIAHCRRHGLTLAPLQRTLCGGSPPSAQLIDTLYQEFGVKTVHAWGMTETTHGVTFMPSLPRDGAPAPTAGYPQGRPVYGAAIRAVRDDGTPGCLESPGRIQSRGHWMAAEYFRRPDIPLTTEDGWMETGDVGFVTDAQEMRITDREKDAIKSGGEWISSQALENAIAEMPEIAAAAVIGAAHPRWVERPVAIAVRRDGAKIDEADILAFLAARFPKWQVPDRVAFVDALPLTPVGKIDKRALKGAWGDALAGREPA